MDYSQLLSYDFGPAVMALLGATAALLILILTVWLPYLTRVSRKVSDCDIDAEASASSDSPSVSEVSVIVYANNNGDTIEQTLTSILNQKGVAAMEVIVVNDGSYDNTPDIVGRLETTHSNLYMTYAPDNSRNLSRRKLALTLGIKAARYDKLVFTTANAVIQSDRWLQLMSTPLAHGADVVLGYAAPDPDHTDRGAMRTRSFDATWEAVSWLAPAITRHPTRGTGANLAYRRDLFFANKGFSRSLNLVEGDDDIFLNEIMQGRHIAVSIAADAQVGLVQWNPARTHKLNKISRRFTGRRIPAGTRMRLDAGSWMAWLILACGAAAGWLGWPSAIPAAAALLMALGAFIPVSLAWRRTSRSLNGRPLLLTVVPLLLWHPFYNLAYIITGRKHRRRHYTWNTEK